MSDATFGSGSIDGSSATRNGEHLRDEPVAELLNRLSTQTQTLVRQELALAKAELSEKGKRAGLGAGMFGGAGFFGLFAFGVLTTCFILGLAAAVASWLAALIVAAVYAAIGGVLALRGKKEIAQATPPVPEQAKRSVKRDVETTKQRARATRG